MARRPSIIVAAVGLGGAIGLLLVGRSGADPSRLDAVVADLDARVRETAAAAQARAQTLAQLPRLAWAVATDEQTMLDLTADELAFQPTPGEYIEIGQVNKKTGAITSLLRLGAMPLHNLPLADPGMHVVARGKELHAATVVSVEPKQRADEIRGSVLVARLIDLAPVAAKVDELGGLARIEAPGGSLPLGRRGERSGWTGVAVPLHGEAAREAKLIISLPTSGTPTPPFIAAAAVLLLLSFASAALLWRRPAPRTPIPDPPLSELVSQVHVDLRGPRRR